MFSVGWGWSFAVLSAFSELDDAFLGSVAQAERHRVSDDAMRASSNTDLAGGRFCFIDASRWVYGGCGAAASMCTLVEV